MRSKSAFLAGVGAGYFLDPASGRRRRHMVRDRTLGLLRRAQRAAVKKVRLIRGIAQGVVATGHSAVASRDVPVDDETVAQRVRSDALRDADISTREVDVRVDNGFVRLRGSVASIRHADRLISRVQKVPGVRDVSAELRVAGE